ncbi:LysR family transcriptional regulator [Pseudomonas sp. NY15374]|uniref:LysR family transcriptional regulator n=1 Tax=Pseudomonas sp. NY15374 TaxID=3400357 RepID=UPI003A8A7869
MNTKDIRQLRHFITVADELHFGRAAERLSMTQPPLSQSILDLEESLKFKLFERNKRNVALTPIGKLWLPYVKAVISALEGLPDIAYRLQRGEIGTIRLSFVSSVVYSLLPNLVANYKNNFAQVELILKEATTDVQIRDLLDRVIDVGVIIPASGSTLPSELASKKIRSEPLVAAVHQDTAKTLHAESNRTINLSALAEHPLIMFPRETCPGLHDLIYSYFELRGLKPLLGQQAIQMQTIISLVSQGMGYALVPESMANLNREGVAYFYLHGTCLTVDTAIAWNIYAESPAVRALIKLSDHV